VENVRFIKNLAFLSEKLVKVMIDE
jgi:hypothetical protein